ncbi:cytochrome c-550 PedF [Aliiglaciecola sp. 2_MG-2023]|uniref:cytochrome c-550 PedF n=1 Tax=unclassified Aliiglaciecola TaxID=2593648 RepID=UPI0026E3553F|nr:MULTISPECIES: cytochrome c-550 PedF [unclassified Aliiglaciecola]MDO6711754.1 cytochrome c-550 PedF [Aliiglaciecola sp. 2_MG-2023]MDO6752825.1 cytochrome c-550 PedF [Aliiglaciecola sp. 1_MG-2023]
MNKLATAVCASSLAMMSVFTYQVYAHGDVTPQAVDVSSLPQLGEEWRETNPFTGNEQAIKVGDSAYNQNCARCHGLAVISGGITPDLRKLNDPNEFFSSEEADAWFMSRIRHGAVVDGRVYMPPFEGILSQEAMWAIKAYIETRDVPE